MTERLPQLRPSTVPTQARMSRILIQPPLNDNSTGKKKEKRDTQPGKKLAPCVAKRQHFRTVPRASFVAWTNFMKLVAGGRDKWAVHLGEFVCRDVAVVGLSCSECRCWGGVFFEGFCDFNVIWNLFRSGRGYWNNVPLGRWLDHKSMIKWVMSIFATWTTHPGRVRMTGQSFVQWELLACLVPGRAVMWAETRVGMWTLPPCMSAGCTTQKWLGNRGSLSCEVLSDPETLRPGYLGVVCSHSSIAVL